MKDCGREAKVVVAEKVRESEVTDGFKLRMFTAKKKFYGTGLDRTILWTVV